MVKWGFSGKKCTLESAKRCVGKGWGDLVEEAWRYCDENNIAIYQIKEKFGGLRFYTEYQDITLGDIIDRIENKSFEICEVCGKKGYPREGGWIKTLCDECANKRKLND